MKKTLLAAALLMVPFMIASDVSAQEAEEKSDYQYDRRMVDPSQKFGAHSVLLENKGVGDSTRSRRFRGTDYRALGADEHIGQKSQTWKYINVDWNDIPFLGLQAGEGCVNSWKMCQRRVWNATRALNNFYMDYEVDAKRGKRQHRVQGFREYYDLSGRTSNQRLDADVDGQTKLMKYRGISGAR